MNRKNILQVIPLILILAFPPGCHREEFNWGIKIGNITYSGNVIFLGKEELGLIKEVNAGRIVFAGKAGQINNIIEKSILVMGVSEKTPYGLLRKVTSLRENGSDYVITTSEALLSEAIKEGTVNLHKKLLEKDFSLVSIAEGVLVTGPNKLFDGLAVTLNNLKIFETGTNIVRLKGAIGISPEIGISFKNEANQLKTISLTTSLDKIDEITVTSDGAFNGSHDIVAAEFIHKPVVIDSLVFVTDVKISCGFDGTVAGVVSSGVRQDRTISSKMNYEAGIWSADPLSQSAQFDYVIPQVTGTSALKIFSGPEITIRLFGVPVQTLKASGFYSLEAGSAFPHPWKLLVGNNGYNTVNADLFGLDKDYTFSMEIQASEIGKSER